MKRNVRVSIIFYFFFFFNDTATTEIYTLSLHDALPILAVRVGEGIAHIVQDPHRVAHGQLALVGDPRAQRLARDVGRSEEHTSELQSQSNLVCRLLLEKKKREAAECDIRGVMVQLLVTR